MGSTEPSLELPTEGMGVGMAPDSQCWHQLKYILFVKNYLKVSQN